MTRNLSLKIQSKILFKSRISIDCKRFTNYLINTENTTRKGERCVKIIIKKTV